MLLQFAVENYLSFRDRAVLSMLADPRVTHEPGQVLEGPGGQKVLRAAGVYGANGSGKSNLVKALRAARDLVLEGTRGEERLRLNPFKLDAARRDVPIHFELELVAAQRHYSYGFEATPKLVQAEWLYEIRSGGDEVLVFEREASSEKPRITLGPALTDEPRRRGFLEYVADGTRQNQLFLAEAGERNVTELDPIRAAIRGWNIVRPHTTYQPLTEELTKNEEFRNLMGLVLKEAGTGIDDLRVSKQVIRGGPARALSLEEEGRPEFARVFGVHRLPGGESIDLSMSKESDGTRRLLNLAPTLFHVIEGRGGEALTVIDEMERSLHPLLTRMLLELFFARAPQGATTQLIFTTHDTNLLDLRILPRDSIWLMEKDARGGSVMYPLSDLDQAQLDEVEKQGRGLERGYLQGRFGAIPFFGSLRDLGLRREDLR